MDPHEAIAGYAALCRHRLQRTILPYWLARSRDDVDGGYLLRDDVLRPWMRRLGRRVLKGPGPPRPEDKQLVDQARLLWVFSHAHRKGVGAGDVYLHAASRGYQFLLERFLDQVHGGYVWMTDRTGRPVNTVKHLYGQAFVIYGMVEYSRASGDVEALDHAISLHRTVAERLHDDAHGGWREHGADDWSVLASDDPRVEVPLLGRKSGNAAVHWIEALAELCAESGDDRVRQSLTEALDVSGRFLFPQDPERTRALCLPDWTPDRAAENPVSYGHNVEFAWLMVRAQRVLGLEPARGQFHAYLDHTLRYGFDHARGGVYMFGRHDRPADRRYKTWWVQCEFVAALADPLLKRDDDRYAQALARTLAFMERHLTDRRDGVTLESVEEDGRRRSPRKAGHWKAGYHEVRATVKLVEAFDRPDGRGR